MNEVRTVTSKPVKVLITHCGDDWIRGSETLLLDLVRNLNREVIRPIVWCNARSIEKELIASGIDVVRTEMPHFMDYDAKPIRKSSILELHRVGRKIIQSYGIQVLHSNGAAPGQFLVPLARRENLPVFAYLMVDYLKRERFINLLHLMDRVVGMSQGSLAGVQLDGVNEERIDILYAGIDTNRLTDSSSDFREQHGIPKQSLVIAAVGSMISRKGHDLLIRAFSQLPDDEHAPRLILCGGGPEERALRELSVSLGVADRVIMPGYVSSPVPVYKAANIFALASRVEGFGLVFAEAGHFGLPAVSTFVGGIPEAVANGVTGLLVPPENVDALAKALKTLAYDPKLRSQMGSAAEARVEKLFTAKSMARSFEKTYIELASIPKHTLGWRSTLQKSLPYIKLPLSLFKKSPPVTR
jgi:L-malate glycosyltransferase